MRPMNSVHICGTCSNNTSNSLNISCGLCSCSYHTGCIEGMSDKKLNFLIIISKSESVSDIIWLCRKCLLFFNKSKLKIYDMIQCMDDVVVEKNCVNGFQNEGVRFNDDIIQHNNTTEDTIEASCTNFQAVNNSVNLRITKTVSSEKTNWKDPTTVSENFDKFSDMFEDQNSENITENDHCRNKGENESQITDASCKSQKQTKNENESVSSVEITSLKKQKNCNISKTQKRNIRNNSTKTIGHSKTLQNKSFVNNKIPRLHNKEFNEVYKEQNSRRPTKSSQIGNLTKSSTTHSRVKQLKLTLASRRFSKKRNLINNCSPQSDWQNENFEIFAEEENRKEKMEDVDEEQADVEKGIEMCHLCGKSCPNKKSLAQHVKRHSLSRHHKCDQCQKAFAFPYLLDQHHKAVHEGYKPYKCLKCDKSFPLQHLLNQHDQRVHSQDKLYQCTQCPKSYAKRFLLDQHFRRVHNGEKLFVCKLCEEKFSWRYQLDTHVRTVHVGDEYPTEDGKPANDSVNLVPKPLRQCQTCGKTFLHRCDFVRHQRIHSGVRPYNCQYCQKTFALKRTKDEHERIHTGVKPFQCSQCGRCFSRRCNYRTHVKTHSSSKDFQCDQCGGLFKTKHSLKEHGKIHTGYKPHICRTCGKAFTWRQHLINHERLHTGLKPFVCQFCGKAFAERWNMVVHARSHVGLGKPYKCATCGESFARKKGLVEHEKIHVNINIAPTM